METIDCAIVWGIQGAGGVPTHRGCSHRIVLMRAYTPRTKRMSCKGQGKGMGGGLAEYRGGALKEGGYLRG